MSPATRCTGPRASRRRCSSARPNGNGGVEVHPEKEHLFEVVKNALGLEDLRMVETGGNAWQAQHEHWDDGNNVVALEPGVVVAYDRNTYMNTLLQRAGVEVVIAFEQAENRLHTIKAILVATLGD